MFIDLLNLNLKAIEEERLKKVEIEKKNKAHSDALKLAELTGKDFDIFGRKKFVWVAVEHNEYSLIDDNEDELVIKPLGDGLTVEIHQDFVSIVDDVVMTLDECLTFCENFAVKKMDMKFGDLNGYWLKKAVLEPATLEQEKYLTSIGLFQPGMSKGQAFVELQKEFALKKQRERLYGELIPATYSQKKLLKENNINPERLDKRGAKKVIKRFFLQKRLEGSISQRYKLDDEIKRIKEELFQMK